jgi:hypothetical protein
MREAGNVRAVNKAAAVGQPVTPEIAVSVKKDKVECAIKGDRRRHLRQVSGCWGRRTQVDGRLVWDSLAHNRGYRQRPNGDHTVDGKNTHTLELCVFCDYARNQTQLERSERGALCVFEKRAWLGAVGVSWQQLG